MEDTRPIQTREAYDVVVVGGGAAGVAAAVAAARQGAGVLLLEKAVALGGLATLGLISWYEPLCDGKGTQMVGGIAEELLRLAVRYGFDDLPGDWREKDRVPEPREGRYATHFSPTLTAMALDEYTQSQGVRLRFDTAAVFPVMEGGVCRGVLCESLGGREFFPAKAVIDATGTACVMAAAGVPTRLGENFLTYVAHYTSRELAGEFAGGGAGAKFRKWRWAGSSLSGKGHPQGMPPLVCRDSGDVTDFVLRGRALLFEQLREENREDRDVTMLPMMPQYRTIRHIVGEYEFLGTEEGAAFEDAVGSMGDFRRRGPRFQLPYRTLYHRDFPNLFAAGRIISAHGDGWEITRVIPVAALSGQAAGTAAALCVRGGCAAHQVPVAQLQEILRRSGVLFRI